MTPKPRSLYYPLLIFILLIGAALFASHFAKATEKKISTTASNPVSPALSMEQFLAQVATGNQTVAAAREASQGADLRSSEASLMYLPVFDAQSQWLNDKRQSAFLVYERFVNHTFDAGISQVTPWGLRGRMSYNLIQTGYEGLGKPIYYYGSPKIELTLSLWRNFFGSETRAEYERADASALAAKFGESYTIKATRAGAENAYIQLAAARELDKVNRDSFERAKEIYEWNQRRTRLNLSEDSDLFQAEANLESLRLSVASSSDALRTASRAFNQARGVDSEIVPETLLLTDPKSVRTPERGLIRDDVRAARELHRASAAAARLGREKNEPLLEVYGAYARNSQDIEKSDAFKNSFDTTSPTNVFGIRLSLPLAVGVSSAVREGYEKEKIAAELLANQKLFDQEIEWKSLVEKLADAKARLAYAEKLADIQKRKALNERLRLKRGRTTTYQSLIFETDYNQAEYRRIQTQSEVLTLLAQMKTFGG